MQGLCEGPHRQEFISALEADIAVTLGECEHLLELNTPDECFRRLDSTIIRCALRFFGKQCALEDPELSRLKAERICLLDSRRQLRGSAINVSQEGWAAINKRLSETSRQRKQLRKKIAAAP